MVGLTNNGVRAHLATLERYGVVRQHGTVRPASGASAVSSRAAVSRWR